MSGQRATRSEIKAGSIIAVGLLLLGIVIGSNLMEAATANRCLANGQTHLDGKTFKCEVLQ